MESGLNDGIALPILLVVLRVAEESADGGSLGSLLSFIGQEVLIAAAVGIAIGWIGGKILVNTARRDWVGAMWLQLGALALAIAAYSLRCGSRGCCLASCPAMSWTTSAGSQRPSEPASR